MEMVYDLMIDEDEVIQLTNALRKVCAYGRRSHKKNAEKWHGKLHDWFVARYSGENPIENLEPYLILAEGEARELLRTLSSGEDDEYPTVAHARNMMADKMFWLDQEKVLDKYIEDWDDDTETDDYESTRLLN